MTDISNLKLESIQTTDISNLKLESVQTTDISNLKLESVTKYCSHARLTQSRVLTQIRYVCATHIYTYDVTEGASRIHYTMTSSKVRPDRDLGAHEVRVLAIFGIRLTDRYIPNGEIYRSNAIKGICRFISCTALTGSVRIRSDFIYIPGEIYKY